MPSHEFSCEVLSGSAGVERAAELLRQGRVVAIPTETVYGLACDGMNAQAVARVFEVKRRPDFDPLILHAADIEAAREVAVFNDLAEKLAQAHWPGPLTLVLKRKACVPDLVTAGRDSVGVRIPNHSDTLALLERVGRPLAAPSANPFGYISPTRPEHVLERLGNQIDALLDGGACGVGVESTVLRALDDRLEVLRPGGLSVDEIQRVVGDVPIRHGKPVHAEVAAQGVGLAAPGTLKSHYAPGCPLVLVQSLEALPEPRPEDFEDSGLLAFRAPPAVWQHGFRAVEVLSESGDPREAAANLFAAMRRLDAMGLRQIIAERAPDQGLGVAINDRLERAAE